MIEFRKNLNIFAKELWIFSDLNSETYRQLLIITGKI